jgi:hypothetical protein
VARVAAVGLVLAVACGCAPTHAQTVAPGIYGDVSSSVETGDLGGVELELIGTGADARVELVVCEGWCNYIHRAPVSFTSDGFTFSYVERYTDLERKPSGSATFNAVAVRKGDGLSLTITNPGPPTYSFTQNLPLIDQRFGLDVASGED